MPSGTATLLGHPRTSEADFEAQLRNLAHLVVQYTWDRFTPVSGDLLERLRVVHLSHEGWKKAQNTALALVLEIKDELAEVSDLVTQCNRRRDRGGAKALRQVEKELEVRSRRVRSAIDAIVWIICDRRHYVVRRLWTYHVKATLDRYSLLLNLSAADNYNRSPDTCAILSDLTRFVNIGDLVISRHDGENPSISLVEVKSGHVNAECDEVLQCFRATGSQQQFAAALEGMDDKTRDQVGRIMRQTARLEETVKVLTTDRGIDPSTGKTVVLSKEVFAIKNYLSVVVSMCEEIESGARYAIRDVDDCLYLGMYRNRQDSWAFRSWMKGIEVDSPIYPYLPNVTRVSIACPTLALPLSAPFVIKLYTGELWLMMCLDIRKWIEVVNRELSCEITLATRRESGQEQRGPFDFIKHHQRLLKLSFEGRSSFLGMGILDRILAAFEGPVSTLSPYAKRAAWDFWEQEGQSAADPVGPET